MKQNKPKTVPISKFLLRRIRKGLNILDSPMGKTLYYNLSKTLIAIVVFALTNIVYAASFLFFRVFKKAYYFSDSERRMEKISLASKIWSRLPPP